MWKWIAAVVVTATVIAIAPAASAGTGPPAGLRPALDAMVDAGYPGVIAYARQDDRRWRLAAGVADRATGEPARPTDRVRIFSNTKSFVSTVLLQLVGERRLRLDDPVERWLPGVMRGAKVTVRQLLNNTSGVYDPGPVGRTPQEVVAAAMAHPPLFPPGTRYDYSNPNYLLAGMVVEAVTHHGPDVEIRRRILDPLGLRHTTFPLHDPTIAGPHLHGYDLSDRDITRFDPTAEWTAGAMISTLDDLARFDRALFGGKLLRPAQQRDLETTVPTDNPAIGYGLGVERLPVPCGAGSTDVWETDGGGPGYTTASMTSVDGGRQFVLAGNVFDLDAESHGRAPVPDAREPFLRAVTSVVCGT
jgi:D-alanyl-D-alanine carboxypeptidase